MDQELYDACVEACRACSEACEHCESACLREHDVTKMAALVKLALDCAELCRLTTVMLQRRSRFAIELCRICTVACEACARECRRHAQPYCRACGDACHRCAEVCREMATARQVPAHENPRSAAV
jgi:hypothetical protein